MGTPSLQRVVELFLKAAKPAGEYSGIQTFVSEKPSKGIQEPQGDSTSHPPGESPKSDRERAKPQRTDTKENLERHTPSNTVFNVPGPSDDPGPNPKTNITVRSPGTPGEEYGHPFKENIYPRRTGGLYPPYSERQHDQRGDAKKYYKRYYRENKSRTKLRSEKRYKKLKHSPSFLRDKERRNDPMYEDRFHRLPAGGVRTPAERSKDYREDREASPQRVVATFYREVFTKGYNLDPGEGAQDLGRPSQYSPSLRYPDTDHNDRPPAESMNNIREVDNNPGSAKVIPEGHGFENKKASSTIRLFRGMGLDEYLGFLKTGILSRGVSNRANSASVDYEVAEVYAKNSDEGDGSVLLEFEAPSQVVEQDPWFEGDYKFLRPFKPRLWKAYPYGRLPPLVPMQSSANRVAARAMDILRGVDRSVSTSAKRLPNTLVSSDQGLYTFTVKGSGPKPYIVTVEVSGDSDLTKANLRLSCTCDFWQWQGPEHWAKSGGYLLGDPRGTAARPSKRDPKGGNRVCKHSHSVLTTIRGWGSTPPVR